LALVRRVPFGLYANLLLEIDPSCETQLLLGLYERETYPGLRKAVTKARSAVDVGAGNGEMTVWFLSKENLIKVHAFEPDGQRKAKFERNIRANNFKTDGRLFFHPEPFGGSNAKQLLQELSQPILLKIDIDGGEGSLLEEIREELRSRSIQLLLEVHSEELWKRCSQLLKEEGYQVREIRQGWLKRIIPERRPSAFNQWLVASKAD